MDTSFNRRHTQRKGERARIRFYLIIGGACLLLVGAAYVLLYSPVFRIRAFTINGKEYHSDREILAIIEPLVLDTWMKNFLGPQNLFAWNVAKPDTSRTALAEATVGRGWIRQTVTITVRERERVAIWCDVNGVCDWIDGNAMAFEEAPQTEGSLILTIYGTDSVMQGTQVVEDRFVANLISIIQGIGPMQLPIKKITYDPKLEELHVQTYGVPDLYFSVRFDPAQNISSLHALEQKMNISKLNYIDLRAENRIYYR